MCVEHTGTNILNSTEIDTRNCKDIKLFNVKWKKKPFNINMIPNAG